MSKPFELACVLLILLTGCGDDSVSAAGDGGGPLGPDPDCETGLATTKACGLDTSNLMCPDQSEVSDLLACQYDCYAVADCEGLSDLQSPYYDCFRECRSQFGEP